MGIRDCDRTRVAPVFNWLLAQDPSGRSWVGPLLRVAGEPSSHPLRRALGQPGRLRDAVWWPDGVSLDMASGLSDIVAKQMEAAERRASRGQGSASWPAKWVALRESRPSALLETARVVAAIEGRRTSPGKQDSPEEEAYRVIRDLDALYDDARGRFLAGLLIVEDDGGRPGAAEILGAACDEVATNKRLVARWLPHREPSQRLEIAGAFLGVTSWQRVCRELEVPWAALPDIVLDIPQEGSGWPGRTAELDAEVEHSVAVGRDLDVALEPHRVRLAKRAKTRFPPMTLTDAARRALASFYRSPAWANLRQSASEGIFPARRTGPTADRWHFVLPRDVKLLAAIEWHADLLDGTWDDAVDDALFRYYDARGEQRKE